MIQFFFFLIFPAVVLPTFKPTGLNHIHIWPVCVNTGSDYIWDMRWSCCGFTFHTHADLFFSGTIGIDIKWADITSVVVPRHILHGDGSGIERLFCQLNFPLVRCVHSESKAFAVRCQILQCIIFEPLPGDLKNTFWTVQSVVVGR